MIVFGSIYIQTNESLTLKSVLSTFCLLQRKIGFKIQQISEITLEKIVKNVIVIDLLIFYEIAKKKNANVDVSKILIGQYNPSN